MINYCRGFNNVCLSCRFRNFKVFQSSRSETRNNGTLASRSVSFASRRSLLFTAHSDWLIWMFNDFWLVCKFSHHKGIPPTNSVAWFVFKLEWIVKSYVSQCVYQKNAHRGKLICFSKRESTVFLGVWPKFKIKLTKTNCFCLHLWRIYSGIRQILILLNWLTFRN